jgi:predicted secreted protein
MPLYALGAEKSQQFKFSKDQQIQQVKPKKPVRIKLHRNAKGEYSWDLTGDNVDEVFQADRRLRKLLKVE